MNTNESIMKSVQFKDSDSLCTILCHVSSRSTSSKGDMRKKWYNEEDYELFTLERNYCSKKLRKDGKDTLLDRALPCDEEDTFDLLGLQSQLLEWTKLEICRGLEARINPAHGNQRARERKQAMFAVLRMQALLRDRTEYLELSDRIRESSEVNTENARMFAYAMGLADEEVVKLELQIAAPTISRRGSIFNRVTSRRASM
jgi:hypothetical protein